VQLAGWIVINKLTCMLHPTAHLFAGTIAHIQLVPMLHRPCALQYICNKLKWDQNQLIVTQYPLMQ
jgi:hypothetical protein